MSGRSTETWEQVCADLRARAEKAEATLDLVRSAEKLETERLAAWNQIEATADIVDPGHLLRVNEELRRRLVLLRNQVPGLTASLDEHRHRAEAAEKRAAALEAAAKAVIGAVCRAGRWGDFDAEMNGLYALLGGGS